MRYLTESFHSLILYTACIVVFLTFPVSAVRADSAADKAWATLTSSGERPERLEGESSLAYFMRCVEGADLRRRELGLKFWNNYPDDARRYEWLTLTVAMPPHYAQDIHLWSENEAKLGINSAPLDKRAVAEWEAVYPDMRAKFWQTSELTAPERRFFWAAELEQKLRRLIEADARNEKVQAEPLLDEIFLFVEAYPEAFGESDLKDYHAMLLAPINIVMENKKAFGLESREAVLTFSERLAKSSNKLVADRGSIIGKIIRERGDYLTYSYTNSTEIGKIWMSLPKPSGRTSTALSRIAFYHDRLVAYRKYRDIGVKLWHQYPDHEQRFRWLLGSAYQPGMDYPKSFVDALWQKSSYWMTAIEVDKRAEVEWQKNYAALRQAFWNDPETTDQQRSAIRGAELRAGMLAAEIAWRNRQDSTLSKELLANIQEYCSEYGESLNALTLASSILREYKNHGLSDEELVAFFEPIRRADNEKLQKVAEAASNQLRLKMAKFDLTAPTMDGRPFSISDLRGKIVLVDHWTTRCGSCINAMPRLHKVYQQYKEKGFEVVSICYNGNEQRKKVSRLKEDMGLTWPTLAGDGLWENISEKYGYVGVPQFMLLDREGKLVAGTGEVDMGRNLPALLDKMLAEENKP